MNEHGMNELRDERIERTLVRANTNEHELEKIVNYQTRTHPFRKNTEHFL